MFRHHCVGKNHRLALCWHGLSTDYMTVITGCLPQDDMACQRVSSKHECIFCHYWWALNFALKGEKLKSHSPIWCYNMVKGTKITYLINCEEALYTCIVYRKHGMLYYKVFCYDLVFDLRLWFTASVFGASCYW